MTAIEQSTDQFAAKPERRLSALALSRGIGIGGVVFLHGEKRKLFRIDLDHQQVETELLRLRSAVSESIDQLRYLAADNHTDQNQPVSSIFGVHQLILEESSFIKTIEEVVEDQRVNAEWALKVVSDQYLEKQAAVSNQHFREKYLDIEDVAQRLLTALSGSPSTTRLTHSGAVVVTNELRPSAIVELAKSKPAGVITTRGGWTSHASILAREFKLPMVSGIKDIYQTFANNDQVIVDGINGQVIINPNPETLELFQITGKENAAPVDLPANFEKPAVTLDGTEIVIRANVDLAEAYEIARNFGAQGIGLFRSESLISRPGNIPSEDEQVSAYGKMADAGGEFGVKIRTFDIGIDQAGYENHSIERNPSLGLRSIRLSLSDLDPFRTQLRAILRASAGRNIDIVLPMISGIGEISRTREIIDEERNRLSKDGILAGEPKLGVMIEVPSAVFTVGEIAQKVDFLCLGTNDLVQYLLAVDRDNDAVADWYETLHPAVIRAICAVLSAAENAGIPVEVCGEMAGSPFYAPVLIGLGARELSMNVNSIPSIRHLVSGMTVKEAVNLVDKIVIFETALESEDFLRKYYLENWSGLFPTGLLNSRHR